MQGQMVFRTGIGGKQTPCCVRWEQKMLTFNDACAPSKSLVLELSAVSMILELQMLDGAGSIFIKCFAWFVPLSVFL
jgi:hypothetical protein